MIKLSKGDLIDATEVFVEKRVQEKDRQFYSMLSERHVPYIAFFESLDITSNLVLGPGNVISEIVYGQIFLDKQKTRICEFTYDPTNDMYSVPVKNPIYVEYMEIDDYDDIDVLENRTILDAEVPDLKSPFISLESATKAVEYIRNNEFNPSRYYDEDKAQLLKFPLSVWDSSSDT